MRAPDGVKNRSPVAEEAISASSEAVKTTFFEQPSIETTLSIEYSGVCVRPYGRTCRRFVNAHFIAAGRRNNDSGLRAKPTHMSRVFMDFAAGGETLFKARCGAKDFSGKL